MTKKQDELDPECQQELQAELDAWNIFHFKDWLLFMLVSLALAGSITLITSLFITDMHTLIVTFKVTILIAGLFSTYVVIASHYKVTIKLKRLYIQKY